MFSSQAIRVGVRNLIGRRIVTIAVLSISAVSMYGGVVFSTGFEAPTYSICSVIGQDGWSGFNPSASFANVETAQVKSGSQAVELGAFPSSTVQTGIFHSDSPAGPQIELSADIYLFSSSTQNKWQFAGLGAGLAPFIGGIDVAADNTLFMITSGFTVVGTFTRNAWHHVDFLFNMNTQKYSFALDGSTLASGLAFCGDNGPCAGAPVASYGTSFFDVFATLNSNDLGAIDNLQLSSIPQPGSRLL